MVAVGVVARRAERSAASVIETRFTEALRRTRSGATRQPTASNPFVVKVREKYPAVHVPNSIGLIGLPQRTNGRWLFFTRLDSRRRSKGADCQVGVTRFPETRVLHQQKQELVDRVPFQLGNANNRGQVSRFSSAMTRTKTRRALRPLVTCVRACRRSTLNSFQAFWQRSVPAILTFLLNSYLSKRNFFDESTVALRERSSDCPAKVACFLNFVSNARSVQPTDTIDTIGSFLRLGQTQKNRRC